MIVFSAITPHSPLFIPSIGGENTAACTKTLESYALLRTRLAEAKPDVLVIMTPHGAIHEQSFPLYALPEYRTQFEQFGDFSPAQVIPGDVLLPTLVKQTLETETALTLIAESTVDHGIAVPSLLLRHAECLPPIAPLGIALLSLEDHLYFGRRLAPLLAASDRRYALVASADLSHRLSALAPSGYSPHGATFDAHILDLIAHNNLVQIPSVDVALAREAGSCGLEPITLLAGMLGELPYHTELLSYEAPFGIGYATIFIDCNQ